MWPRHESGDGGRGHQPRTDDYPSRLLSVRGKTRC